MSQEAGYAQAGSRRAKMSGQKDSRVKIGPRNRTPSRAEAAMGVADASTKDVTESYRR